MHQLGRPTDMNAYFWEEEPDCRNLLEEAADELGATCEAERQAYRSVVDRLLNDLHMPAVKEALGILIPEDLHDDLDDPKKRAKKRGVPAEKVTVELKISGWGLSVFKAEALREHKPVAPDAMEFFLYMARLICQGLQMPIAIGSHALGKRLVEDLSKGLRLEEIEGGLRGWQHFA